MQTNITIPQSNGITALLMTVTRTGLGPSDVVSFELISEREVDEAQAEEFQKIAGYHPAGYGGPDRFECIQRSDGKFVATWRCWASCD